MLNTSISGVLSRSIYTSLTLIFVLLALFIFGPDTLRGFIFLLLIGTLVGTYSSLLLAAPLVYDFHKQK